MPTLGPSALAVRRLAAATAGWRKAGELFKHSCPCTHTTSHVSVEKGESSHARYIALHIDMHATVRAMMVHTTDPRLLSKAAANGEAQCGSPMRHSPTTSSSPRGARQLSICVSMVVRARQLWNSFQSTWSVAMIVAAALVVEARIFDRLLDLRFNSLVVAVHAHCDDAFLVVRNEVVDVQPKRLDRLNDLLLAVGTCGTNMHPRAVQSVEKGERSYTPLTVYTLA